MIGGLGFEVWGCLLCSSVSGGAFRRGGRRLEGLALHQSCANIKGFSGQVRTFEDVDIERLKVKKADGRSLKDIEGIVY